MWTLLFWQSAFERAVKTFAQAVVALLSASGVGLLDAPWYNTLSAAGMAALLSVLTSIASERVGERNTPSILRSGVAATQSSQPGTTVRA